MKKNLTIISLFILSNCTTAFFSSSYSELEANSYYAASTKIIIDETISSLEASEKNFIKRLKQFKKNQILTYENRGDLLESLRAFQKNGQKLRLENK